MPFDTVLFSLTGAERERDEEEESNKEMKWKRGRERKREQEENTVAFKGRKSLFSTYANMLQQ